LVAQPTTKEAVEKHVSELKTQMQDITLTPDELTKLRVRIAKLASGVALIKVGGATEQEMIERKYRIEDALHATRAAVEEGIVPGGGMALFDVWSSLTQGGKITEFSPGERVVLSACLAPIQRIVENSGQSKDVVLNELKKIKVDSKQLGYNAATDEYVDMVSQGVIDPVKVTRTAFKNASSVATTFLSLDAVIVEEED